MKRTMVKRGIAALILLGCLFVFGMGAIHTERQEFSGILGSYEQFEGIPYDKGRMEPVDMMQLLETYRGQSQRDKKVDSYLRGWSEIQEGEDFHTRYYVEEGEYLIGWQQLFRDDGWDWYYFEESTGYLIKDTILDGVVLGPQGHAVAISASGEESLRRIEETIHCREALLLEDISLQEPLQIARELMLVGQSGETVCIQNQNSAGTFSKTGLLEIQAEGRLILADSVTVKGSEETAYGILLKDQGTLECYGQMLMDSSRHPTIGICSTQEDTSITLYPGSRISGGDIGIYSMGETILTNRYGLAAESQVSETQNIVSRTAESLLRKAFSDLDLWLPRAVSAATVDAGQEITGNTHNGIVQDGGTLIISGGSIYNNGTLGGYEVEGSYGGGVRVINGAVMTMTGGTISANRAAYGGGIYVDGKSFCYIQGGCIGGSYPYDVAASNDRSAGNFARENQLSANGMCFAKGGGGGICSYGNTKITGEAVVTIANNRTEGAVGGAGLLFADGIGLLSGEVDVHHNQAQASKAASVDQVVGQEDPDGEGAGIRLGLEETGCESRVTVNCSNEEEFPELTGSIDIRQNQATDEGGGIFVSSGSYNQIVVKGDTEIFGNSAKSGGGAGSDGGSLFLYDTLLYENRASGQGGGVLGAGILNMETCSIYANQASKGGGIAVCTSRQGVACDSYIDKCSVYQNTAADGGSGVNVAAGATGRVQGESVVYENQGGIAGAYCAPGGLLVVGESDYYGNQGYGLYNLGSMDVKSTCEVGFSAYSNVNNYQTAPNQKGGIYNANEMIVSNSKGFRVFGGGYAALYNFGTATFQEKTCSEFYGRSGESIIYNQGILTAQGKGFFNKPILTLCGHTISYGINNDGGTLHWGSTIKGNYFIGDTAMSAGDAEQGVDRGIYNHNGGELFLTGGECYNCEAYGVYCETGSGLHMSGTVTVDVDNPVFLDKDCIIDIPSPLTTDGVIALLDTAEGTDRKPGRIMARTSYDGGSGAAELYDSGGDKRFLLTYDKVDRGSAAYLLDGSDIQGVAETVAGQIQLTDIYLATDDVPEIESQLTAWLYNHSAWMQSGMEGSKQDEAYGRFIAEDQGVITFSCLNLVTVQIRWPHTGAAEELKTYDTAGNLLVDRMFSILDLTEDPYEPYSNNSYLFTVPPGTPEGGYRVDVLGIDPEGQLLTCELWILVGEDHISDTIRTRIR